MLCSTIQCHVNMLLYVMNRLTGPIDPLWCCTALRKLALNNNSLSGLISGDISNLQKLEV